MLALEQRVAPLLAKGQPIPARLTRLTLYPATWLLHQIKTAPETELLERCNPDTMPTAPPPAKRRRQRRRRRGAAGDEKSELGERAKRSLGERAKGPGPYPLPQTPSPQLPIRNGVGWPGPACVLRLSARRCQLPSTWSVSPVLNRRLPTFRR